MQVADSVTAQMQSNFHYVSGLRAFQSGPAILAAFEKLHTPPDVVLCDGHGIAHPRRCGLASHLGLLLDIPSVGVAEELVYGTYNLNDLAKEGGCWSSVRDPSDGAEIGIALRIRGYIHPSTSASAITGRWSQQKRPPCDARHGTAPQNPCGKRGCRVKTGERGYRFEVHIYE